MKGFTFVELLVTISIVAVLTAIGMVSYSSTSVKSRDTRRKADIESIRSALELYRTDVGNYPVLTADGNGCINSTQIVNGATVYLSPVPADPKNGASYCYKYTRTALTTYTITCTFESGDPCSYANP